MPVGGAAIRSADIDTVLTTAEDARAFVTFLEEKSIPIPRNWFLIHPASSPNQSLPAALRETSFNIAEEVHEYPGCPKL